MLTVRQWGMCIGQKIRNTEGLWDDSTLYGVREEINKEVALCADNNTRYIGKYSKPILRTLDQMTEEEKAEFSSLFLNKKRLSLFFIGDGFVACYILVDDNDEYPCNTLMIDWLTAKGFDIRGWIEQGLAIKQEANNG